MASTDNAASTKSKALKVEQHKMTFAAYDEFIARASEIELYGLQPFWPTPEDIVNKGARFSIKQLTLLFAWLLEVNPEPVTGAEYDSYFAMRDYVYAHLKLVDSKNGK